MGGDLDAMTGIDSQRKTFPLIAGSKLQCIVNITFAQRELLALFRVTEVIKLIICTHEIFIRYLLRGNDGSIIIGTFVLYERRFRYFCSNGERIKQRSTADSHCNRLRTTCPGCNRVIG